MSPTYSQNFDARSQSPISRANRCSKETYVQLKEPCMKEKSPMYSWKSPPFSSSVYSAQKGTQTVQKQRISRVHRSWNEPLYTQKSCICILTRALYTRQRAIYTGQKALYLIQIEVRNLMYTETSLKCTQKSPTHPEKSLYTYKEPSDMYVQKSPISHANRGSTPNVHITCDIGLFSGLDPRFACDIGLYHI